MSQCSKTQSLSFSAGGTMTFVLPDRINTLSLSARFDEHLARTGETLSVGAQGASLDMLRLDGNGRIEWDNSADDTTAVSHVDASALEGGLEYTGSASVQETIDLGGEGSGVDVLSFASNASRFGQNGDAVDTLDGFDSARDTLLIDDEVMVSFDTIDFDYAVVAHDAGSLEEALTLAGEQDSGDAIMPVIIDQDTYLYRDSGPAGLDENDFTLHLEDMAGGIGMMWDRRGHISEIAPEPTGPFTDVVVDGTVSGTENAADSFVLGSDDAWQGGIITDFELGIDRIDVSALTNTDGEPLDFGDIGVTPSGSGSDLRVNDGSWSYDEMVTLVGVPKWDPGAPIGELAYAMGPEDFLFA